MKIVITGNRIDVEFLSMYLSERELSFVTIEYDERSIWNVVGLFRKIVWGDIIHILSLKLSGVEGCVWLMIFLLLKLLRKRMILHWMGSDVLDLSPMFGMLTSRVVDRHLAYSTWLVEELEEKNIESTWLPILPPLAGVYCTPMPDQFTVLVYLGGKGHSIDFYGNEQLKQFVEEFPDVRFLILVNVPNVDKIKSPNTQYFGRVDYGEMDDLYKMSSVLIRITKHDGLSNMVLEALARGRYVIWSQNFPHCFFAKETSEAIKHLKKLQKVDQINLAGYDFISNKFNNDKWLDKLVGVYEEVLNNF